MLSICAHSTLQITRLFEAPMPSLFHDDSRTETCQYKGSLPPISEFKVSPARCLDGAAAIPCPHAARPRRRRHAQPLSGTARAVRQRGLPPLEGAERKRFMDQARTDYMDYAMIGDATATLESGILTLTIDLRPATCPSSNGPAARDQSKS